MKQSVKKQSGFSAVELLVTLLIASAFLISGFQLYSFVVKDGGSSRQQSNANRKVDNYLQRAKTKATDPCTVQNPVSDAELNGSKTISGLSHVNLTTTIECPYGTTSPISKITVTLSYGQDTPQKQVISSTFYKPACPVGFIPVPGSKTYDTNDFCVMKYEAKQEGATTTPKSVPAGTPWMTGITQELAMSYSKNVANCTGCHLITEAEWLTIAENIISVPSNWVGGTVGTNYLYDGHCRGNPGGGLSAPSPVDDSAGTYGINSPGSDQRRTYYLSNGEVIWDFAGNVWEWTAGQTAGGQPGASSEAWREWNALSTVGTLFPNPYPGNSNVNGASSWNSSHNIGKVYSDTAINSLVGFMRGGGAQDDANAGIYALILDQAPSFTNDAIGFRVAK